MCRKTLLKRMYETSLWICKRWPKSQAALLFLPVLRWNGNSVPPQALHGGEQLNPAGSVHAPTPPGAGTALQLQLHWHWRCGTKLRNKEQCWQKWCHVIALPHSALAPNSYFNLISIKAFTASIPYLPTLGILWKKASSASKNFQSPLFP